MKNKDDGGTVFPVQQYVSFSTGMSLRDYFAGQALAGLMSNNDYTEHLVETPIAEMAYNQADAMLEVRKK